MNDTSHNHQVRSAVLWMSSGVMVLAGIVIFQLVVRLIAGPAMSAFAAPSLLKTVVNLMGALGEMVGVLLIPVGLIVGIVKLIRS